MPRFRIENRGDQASVRRIGWIAATIYDHSRYFEKHFEISVNGAWDYDGYPFEITYQIEPTGSNKGSWEVLAYYTDSTYNQPDPEAYTFIKMASRSTTTAYKPGKKGIDKPVKFYPVSMTVEIKTAPNEAGTEALIIRLEDAAKRLREGTVSLAAWANAGLAMSVKCEAWDCEHTVILTPEQLQALAHKADSIEDFRKKLSCKKCGHRGGYTWAL